MRKHIKKTITITLIGGMATNLTPVIADEIEPIESSIISESNNSFEEFWAENNEANEVKKDMEADLSDNSLEW